MTVLYFRASSGTSIEFTFNFGDGHFEVVNGTDNVYLMISASVKHIYTQGIHGCLHGENICCIIACVVM